MIYTNNLNIVIVSYFEYLVQDLDPNFSVSDYFSLQWNLLDVWLKYHILLLSLFLLPHVQQAAD